MSLSLLWRSEYETGVRNIDNEHRGMFMLAQKVFDSSNLSDPLPAGRAILRLYRYVRTHFDHEESAMREQHYPGLPVHRKLHEALTRELDRVAAPELDPELRRVLLRRLMFEWVVEHITLADRAFAEFLSAPSHRITARPPALGPVPAAARRLPRT